MRVKQGFELRKLGSEEIIVASGVENIDFSNIISMNPSAALLWKAVKDIDFSVAIVADILVENYEIDKKTATADSKDLIEQWLAAGIITE